MQDSPTSKQIIFPDRQIQRSTVESGDAVGKRVLLQLLNSFRLLNSDIEFNAKTFTSSK